MTINIYLDRLYLKSLYDMDRVPRIIHKILYHSQNIKNTDILKIHCVIMASARTIIGNYCFKKSK